MERIKYIHDILVELNNIYFNGIKKEVKWLTPEMKGIKYFYFHSNMITIEEVCNTNPFTDFPVLETMAKGLTTNNHRMGMDLNADHWACSEIDRFGNLVSAQRIPCVTQGKTTAQTQAIIGDEAKIVTDWAVRTSKPLVIEDLDFKDKKAELSKETAKWARALSAFAYGKMKNRIQSAAFKKGVEVLTVNPAYTSVMGEVKDAKRAGI